MPDAARYHRLRLVLAAAGLALSIGFLAALLLTGAAHALARAAADATASAWGQVAIVAVVLGAARAVLTFPLGWIRGWWLPRRFGLLHQSLQGWLADRAKATLLSGVFGLAAVEVVYALLGATPLWWLWATAALLAASVAHAARRRGALREALDARAPCRRPGGRRVGRRPVTEEPHGERRARRARPHATHRALRHAHRAVHPRGDRVRAGARAGPPPPRRRASRPRRAGRADARELLAGGRAAARRRARARAGGTRRPRGDALAGARAPGALARRAPARQRRLAPDRAAGR